MTKTLRARNGRGQSKSRLAELSRKSGTLTITQAAVGSATSALPVSGKGDWIVHMNNWVDKYGNGHLGCLELLGLSDVSELVAYEKSRGIQWITVKCGDGDWGVQANGNYDSYYADQWNSDLITACHKAGSKCSHGPLFTVALEMIRSIGQPM